LSRKTLNVFYVGKLLPSFANDLKDKKEGLNNFYGKLVIFSQAHNEITNCTLIKDMHTKLQYDYSFNIYDRF